jgi:hypothetical protein
MHRSFCFSPSVSGHYGPTCGAYAVQSIWKTTTVGSTRDRWEVGKDPQVSLKLWLSCREIDAKPRFGSRFARAELRGSNAKTLRVAILFFGMARAKTTTVETTAPRRAGFKSYLRWGSRCLAIRAEAQGDTAAEGCDEAMRA